MGDENKEIWKDISNYIGYYQVSNIGRVRSVNRIIETKNGHKRFYKGMVLKFGFHDFGYPKVNLRKDGKVNCQFVHRLVCEAFHGKPKRNYEVGHRDGKPENCKEKNLRWVTKKENSRDKIKHRTHFYGENHPYAKLKERDVLKIKNMLKNGIIHKDIAKIYVVHEKTITAINTNRSWKHLQSRNNF